MDLQTAFDRGFEAVKAYIDAELGTLAARLAELEARPTEKGDVGPQGEAGPAGPAGAEGPAGPQGERGDVGPAGTQGPIGDRGEKGETGRDGRDASDLTVIGSYVVEEVKATVAATVADVFQRATITSPDGGRTLVLVLADKSHEIKTAIPLDAGVWAAGRTYVAGDAVSYDGSLFIVRGTTTAKPGKSDDWRLAVKRGHDGRDYRPDDKRAVEPVRFK